MQVARPSGANSRTAFSITIDRARPSEGTSAARARRAHIRRYETDERRRGRGPQLGLEAKNQYLCEDARSKLAPDVRRGQFMDELTVTLEQAYQPDPRWQALDPRRRWCWWWKHDPEILSSVAKCIRERGFDVITAGNGRQALDQVKARDVSLILLDLKMPEMGGAEFVTRLRQIGCEAPVVLVLGDEQPGRARLAVGRGLVSRQAICARGHRARDARVLRAALTQTGSRFMQTISSVSARRNAGSRPTS